MLVDNFKPLMFFGSHGTIKDVGGNEQSVDSMLTGVSQNFSITGHTVNGVARSFDYSATTSMNDITDETNKTVFSFAGNNTNQESQYRQNYAILFIGNGTTSPSAQDYKLENPINIPSTYAECSINADGKMIVERSFYNNTEEEITVNEVGLYILRIYNNTSEYNHFMIGRKVLKTPITIPVGETRIFSYVIDMNFINFAEADGQ